MSSFPIASSDLEALIKAASQEDIKGDSPTFKFLKQFEFTDTDLKYRVSTKDFYMFYSFWYYCQYGKVVHRYKFITELKKYKTKVSNRWYLKCSSLFKTHTTRFIRKKASWEKLREKLRRKPGLKRKRLLEIRTGFRLLKRDFFQG